MICPRCKTEMNDDMNFCPQCGLKIQKCPSCHQPIVDGAKFCTHCGIQIHSHYQESQIGGYYQPINESQQDTAQVEPEETISFQDVPVNRHVHKKVVIIATAIMLTLTTLSYIYIYHGPSLNNQNENTLQSDLPQAEPMEVKETTSFATHTGNINQAGYVCQNDDRIFMIDDNGYLVSMNKKLEDRKTLIHEKCDYLNVVDNIIYYTNSKHQLSSITVDGKDQKVVLDKDIYYLIVKGDKAYYQSQDGDQERLYVYDLKTNKETRLNDRHTYNINVLDDKIYYTSKDGIYSIGIDGKGDEKLLNEQSFGLIYQEGQLFFTTQTGEYKSYDVKSHEVKTLLEGVNNVMNITDDYAFYLKGYSEVMKYDFKTKTSTKIYSGTITGAQIVGDKIILYTTSSGLSQKNNDYQVIMDFDGNNQQRLFASQDGTFI